MVCISSRIQNYSSLITIFSYFQIRPALPSTEVINNEDDCDVDIDEEEDERVLVINHETFKNETASPEEDEDSGREHSA